VKARDDRAKPHQSRIGAAGRANTTDAVRATDATVTTTGIRRTAP
jgi:hypothetical protein